MSVKLLLKEGFRKKKKHGIFHLCKMYVDTKKKSYSRLPWLLSCESSRDLESGYTMEQSGYTMDQLHKDAWRPSKKSINCPCIHEFICTRQTTADVSKYIFAS